MKGLLWVLFFLLSVDSQANQADLSSQFRKDIPIQEAGNYACHVYATTALIEAACFRKTKQHLDLSESLLLYGHYVRDIENKTATPIQDSLSEYQTFPPFLPSEEPTLLGAERDGGFTFHSLAIATSGWLCEESRFLDWQSFKSQVGLWRWMYKIFGDVFWNQSINQIILNEFKLAKEMADAGAWTNVTPLLSDCIQSIQLKSELYDEARALKLLDDGVPFICTAAATFYERRGGKDKEIVFDPNATGHSTVIMGYQKDSSGVRWRVRDSSVGEVVPARGGCNRIYFIR